MRNLSLALPVCLGCLVAACGGNSNNAAPPSEPTTGEPVPATLAPTEGKGAGDEECGPVATPTATALDACLAECEKLSDSSPQGAKCMPPRVACKSHCKTKFQK